MLGSACESGKCRLGKCSENCKSELDMCGCGGDGTEPCDECCSDLKYCWRSGINAFPTCNKRPKQEMTDSQWWDSTWKDHVDALNEKGKHLTYDFRLAKPECVDTIQSQGTCGSCWAFAAATASAARMCRGSSELSQMDLLCNYNSKTPCSGGHIDQGMNLIAKHGALTTKDFPYPRAGVSGESCYGAKGFGEGTRHKLIPGQHYYSAGCGDGRPGANGFPWKWSCEAYGITPGCSKKDGGSGCYCDSHASFRKHCPLSCGTCQAKGKPFRFMKGREANFNEKIKYELLNYGPVPVSVKLFNDWDFHMSDPACSAEGGGIPMSRQHSKSCCYKNRGGIFTNKQDRGWCDHKKLSSKGTQVGHAMVITGWGLVNGVDFWQIQNSYGLDWGFGGEMRIAMDYLNDNDDESEFRAVISLPKDWRP